MRSAEARSLRTALGVVRGRGSAKSGTGDFIRERVTGLALIPLLTGFIILVVALAGRPYAETIAWLAWPPAALLLLAGILATVIHMRLGMQVIIEDYVHSKMSKFALLIANALFSWGVGLVALFAVLKIAFSGAAG